jgi:hypothetical protein
LIANRFSDSYDADATIPGFMLMEGNGRLIGKYDRFGMPLNLFRIQQAGYYFGNRFSHDQDFAIYFRNFGGNLDNGQEVIINGIHYPSASAPNSEGIQFFRLDFGPVGTVVGRVFNDANNNGQWDSSEQPHYGELVSCLELGAVVSTDSTGGFQFSLAPENDYQFEPVLRPYRTVSTTHQMPYAVTLESDTVIRVPDIGLHLIPNVTDLTVSCAVLEPFRPGFMSQVTLMTRNVGTIAASGTLTATLPDFGTINEVTPVPTSQAGQTLTWDISSLAMDAEFQASVQFTTDANVELLGDTATVTTIIETVAQDQSTVDNTCISESVVIGSYDPNDKSVSPVSRPIDSDFAFGDRSLVYLIRFQNTGTYPTAFVHLKDSISEHLDLSTFRMLGSSHPCQYAIGQDRVVTWGFDPLILADSTSDPEGSQGYVLFSINLTEEAHLSTDEVTNKAYIYFDFNPPIITDPAVFTMTSPTAISEHGVRSYLIYPNPSVDSFIIASDDADEASIYVIDMMGKTVLQTALRGGRQTCDASTWVPGLYLIQVTTTDGGTTVLPFIKR